MNITNENYKCFTYFIVLLVLISSFISHGISVALQLCKINMPFYIKMPSISAIYAMLFWLFDRCLWKFSIFKRLGLTVSDDLHGKWIGFLRSSYDNFEKKVAVELNIQQSATKTKIRGIFNQSKSVSFHENFSVSEIDGKFALFYFFRNDPNYDSKKTMAAHEGSVKLVHGKTKDTLEGYYYSGRDRNNYGTIEVKRAS